MRFQIDADVVGDMAINAALDRQEARDAAILEAIDAGYEAALEGRTPQDAPDYAGDSGKVDAWHAGYGSAILSALNKAVTKAMEAEGK